MSAKGVIQNLEDSELIRLFLDFVQTFHLQYEKIDKEISYKCHEATWILASTKATGYGRTQSEAYKHALRNLLQLLIQDPPYTEFFVHVLTNNQGNRRKSMKKQIKTEAEEETIYKQNKSKMYDSSSKLVIGNYKKNNQKQVYHSKINLNKSSCENSTSEEIKKAKAKMRQLESQLQMLTEENNILRQKLSEHDNIPKNSQYEANLDDNKSKVVIPKLKLDILPNYHKKSQKSLNESLLAVYNQKHGNTKKLI